MFIFMIVFVVASGKPPALIWKYCGIILGSMVGSFCLRFLELLQKTSNHVIISSEMLGLEGDGPPFLLFVC